MNIQNTHNCYGCGMCASVCTKGIIKIELNQDGFYEPILESAEQCTNCELCLRVCPFHNRETDSKATDSIVAYAGWSKDDEIRKQSSSGGISFEIGSHLIKNGFSVCAVKYNATEQRAKHFIAKKEEDLIASIGSKYIQSYTVEAFKSINRREKNLVIGTPCQIDAFRRYIKLFHCEDNFILMDFFCHAVPSMNMWQQYLQMQEKEIGKIVDVKWRTKDFGWHDSWAMKLEGEQGNITSRKSKGDVFYKLFLGDYCSNPACSKNCRFKHCNSSADIRIGDAWGRLYSTDNNGVSAILALTSKGDEILHKCNIELIEHSIEEITAGQLKKNIKKAVLSFVVKRMINSRKIYSASDWHKIIFTEGLFHIPTRLHWKIKKLRK